jgi:hypothetical protein
MEIFLDILVRLISLYIFISIGYVAGKYLKVDRLLFFGIYLCHLDKREENVLKYFLISKRVSGTKNALRRAVRLPVL